MGFTIKEWISFAKETAIVCLVIGVMSVSFLFLMMCSIYLLQWLSMQ
jgi:hypothetical protein